MSKFKMGDRVRVRGSEPEDDDGVIVGVGANAYYVEFAGGMPPIPFGPELLEAATSQDDAS